MLRKKITIILTGIISIFSLMGCSNFEADSRETNNYIEESECTITDGFDILGGTWSVGAIYYKNNMVDIHDNDALEDLYDTIFLTFNEDGTFVYLNSYNYKGNYIKCKTEDEFDSYLLETTSLSRYTLENGSVVEKEVESDALKKFIITLLDEDGKTCVLNEYDTISDEAKVNEHSLIFVKDNTSEYIDKNKINIGNKDEETGSNQNNTSSKSSSSNINKPASSGEKNALKCALDYLEYSAFSYNGLMEQLEFEGFTKAEATYGVDNCGADWNEQAVKKAEEYLEYSAFSYSGLVEQLEFEGFTSSQAEYGASKAY